MPPTWSWKNDQGQYVPTDSTFAKRIEEQFLSGAASAIVPYGGANYTIAFFHSNGNTGNNNTQSFQMTQTNHDSGKSRDIQRDVGLLFFYEDHGGAKGFEQTLSANLEAAIRNHHVSLASGSVFGNSPVFNFNMFNTNYEIDVAALTQKNTQSGKVRKLSFRGGLAALPLYTGPSSTNSTSNNNDDGTQPPAAKKSHAEVVTPVGGVAATVVTNIFANNDQNKSSGGGGYGGSYGAASGGSTGGGNNTSTAIKKGKGIVDTHSGLQHTCHVYEDPNNTTTVFQCMLNQTNIGQNNNKYYVIQLIEPDQNPSKNTFYVFTRWGRVGSPGQQSLDQFNNLHAATVAFKKKFREKTQNDWDNRENFVKVSGKYQLMDIDVGASDAVAGTSAIAPNYAHNGQSVQVQVQPSALGNELQQLMRIISNKSEMIQVMKELKIDTDKMPLGKISKKQIKDAFDYLKKLEIEMKSTHPNYNNVNDLSSMFYTLIPHNFGMATPPMINSEDLLKQKMRMLEALGDLEIAVKLLDAGAANSGNGGPQVVQNPLDQTFNSLGVKMWPIGKGAPEFLRIADYVANTHASTHNQYSLAVEEVFKVVRPGEAERYETYKSMHNKVMLWHGSRTTNFMGILNQGLRIAPPEAPSTGYMYGKGVYFADCSSKSANYCHASPSNNRGFLLLCEVALGTTKDYKTAHYMDKPQSGTNSTRGLGRSCPDPNGAVTVDGVTWPVGKMKPNSDGNSSVLLYPEYIVYDVAQCKIEYMVQLRFNFGGKK